MSPNEFKQWKKQEFNDALQKSCDDDGLTLQIINQDSDTTIYIINNEGYALHNDGNRVWWDKINFRRG